MLVDIRQRQDCDKDRSYDAPYSMCSRHVSAKFTVGPKSHPFSMDCDATNDDGNITITISRPCFYFEDDEGTRPAGWEEADAWPEFDDNEIEAFSLAVGLQYAQPERAYNDDIPPHERSDMTPQERRRWLLGDVIYNAVDLVKEKCRDTNSNDLGLGMEQVDAYEWLGLKYPNYSVVNGVLTEVTG